MLKVASESPERPSAAVKVALGAALFLGLLAAAMTLASRRGLDGDDLAQISGIMHLAERGRDGVYRYYWQPLNYELFARCVELGMPTRWLRLVPAVAASTVIALILLAIRRSAATTWPIALASVALVSELFVSGLYFNSSIVASVPFVGALVLLFGSLRPLQRGIAAGVLAFVAALFRMDFVLGFPLLACSAAFLAPVAPSDRRKLLVGMALGALVTALTAMALGWFVPQRILQTSAAAGRDAGWYGWRPFDSLKVLSVALSPPVTLLLGVSLGFAARSLLGLRGLRGLVALLAWGFAILFVCIPARALMSPKYLLPALVFVPLCLAHFLERLARRSLETRRIVQWLSAGIVVVLYAFFPGATVYTHDGLRVRYGYVGWLLGPSGPRESSSIHVEFAHRLANALEAKGDGCFRVHAPNPPEALRAAVAKGSREVRWWTSEWARWTWPAMHLEQRGFAVRLYDFPKEIEVARGPLSISFSPVTTARPLPLCTEVVLPPIDGEWAEVRANYENFWKNRTDGLVTHASTAP